MIKNNLRKLFKDKFGSKQDVLLAIPGQLGNGKGDVTVPGRTNFVYVRVAGFIEEVYNSRVQANNDLPVIVGYDQSQPKLYQVLSTRATGTGAASGGYAPAIRYQWMAPGGGQDPLFVDKRQILPKRIGPGGGMLIRVMRDIVWTGTAWAVLDTQTADLTSYVPTNASAALYVLVTLNTSGAVVLTPGTETTIALLGLSDIPAVPALTTEVLGAVRVYTGQTEIREYRTNTDVIDLRWSWYDKWLNWDGWRQTGLSWSRASATSMIAAADFSSQIQKGDKVRIYQNSGWKYFYVVSVVYSAPNTTVTLIGDTLATGSISVWYSKVENPQGFPPSFEFATTLAAVAGTFTDASASAMYYHITGGLCYITGTVTIVTNGTASGIKLSLPIQPRFVTIGLARENQVTGELCQLFMYGYEAYIYTYAGSYPNADERKFYYTGVYLI